MVIIPHNIAPLALTSTHSGPRTSGVHLSGILRQMAFAAGKLPEKYAKSSLGELMRTVPFEQAGKCSPLVKAGIGMAWEDWIVQHVKRWNKNFTHQPGELERDGILMTLDGLSEDEDGLPVIHEFKFTYKSMRRPIEEEWLWLAQICGYAAGCEPYFGAVPKLAYLHVAYAMGDYTRTETSGPVYQPYRIELDRDEVLRAWEGILAKKHLADAEVWDGNGTDNNGVDE